MILRTKSGEVVTAERDVLLDYLGIKKDVKGVQKLKGDVELLASVPFLINKDETECEKKGFAWTLSTFDIDRYGERVDPAGWELSNYMKNPVVEWAHRYDIPAIGKIDCLTVDDKGLHGVICFNDKSFDEFGWSIGQRVQAGVIRAGSVGFRVIEIEIPSRDDDGTELIFRKQELLEFSICNVPANPFALAKSIEETKMCSTPSNFWKTLINK